ncbi:MAG: PAS domain S-box protein, partial [Deltaproteobacteria bacterium]
FKVNPAETVGQLIYDLGNKQWDIPKLRELLETILPQKTTFDNYEVEHDFTTIGRRTMLLNARQIHRVLGKERIILLAIEDITARKAIEAGLEKTRKELAVIKIAADAVSEYAESLINTVREPLIALDQDLRVVTVSRSFYDFFKVNPAETVGQLIYDLGNKQWDIPKLRELLETILPQKTTFDNYEVEHDFATIGRRTMLLNARQIHRVLGKERIILLAIEDITEQKKAEKVLAAQEALLLANAYNRTLIEISVDPLMTIDPNGKITDVNTATENATGYTGQELIGTDFSSHFSQPAKAQQAHQQVFLDGIIQNVELELCHRSGSVIQALYNFAVYRNQAGEVVGVFAAARDITKRKRDEEALRVALQAAEAANQVKSLFIGNMSHELRTPLSAVIGMTEMLLNTPVTDQQRDYGEKIRKSGAALLAVVSNVLDFSEIDAGRMVLKNVPFSVAAMIRSVVEIYKPRAAEEKIEFHTTLDPELPVLRGDAQRLTQVVENLVGNAVKFTQAGEIRVAVRILRRTGAEIDLAIDVQDTGIGMTAEEIPRLFKAFSQLDPSMTRRFGGTGMGLVISRNLVQLMGGTIQVASVFGQGSLFTVLVTLPIALGFVGSDLEFAGAGQHSVPIKPPARKEGPPGDLAELRALLEQLGPALASRKPLPCKKILEVLREKSWPEEQETLLAELSRLVRNYRLEEALDLLNKDGADR